jgi:hypothetical protein
MKPLPETPELLVVAERVVLRALDGVIGPGDFREALDHAPPGVFDARSWAYWNLKYGRAPVPPLPVRGVSHEK